MDITGDHFFSLSMTMNTEAGSLFPCSSEAPQYITHIFCLQVAFFYSTLQFCFFFSNLQFLKI